MRLKYNYNQDGKMREERELEIERDAEKEVCEVDRRNTETYSSNNLIWENSALEFIVTSHTRTN